MVGMMMAVMACDLRFGVEDKLAADGKKDEPGHKTDCRREVHG